MGKTSIDDIAANITEKETNKRIGERFCKLSEKSTAVKNSEVEFINDS